MTRPASGSVLLLTALLCWAAPSASAQQPAGLANAPVFAPEQKLLIYQSVSALHKNNAAPPGFSATVGAQVPAGIELQPMPATVVGMIPTTKDMDVAMVEKQVVVVDAKSRTVLAVVTPVE